MGWGRGRPSAGGVGGGVPAAARLLSGRGALPWPPAPRRGSLGARMRLRREEPDQHDPFQPWWCTAVSVRVQYVCQPPPKLLHIAELPLPGARQPEVWILQQSPSGPGSLPPPPWVGTSALLRQEGCRDIRCCCWGGSAALRARLPPSLLLLGSCFRDKRPASSNRGLLYLRGLLGCAGFLRYKIFLEGRQRVSGDGWCLCYIPKCLGASVHLALGLVG